MVAAAGISPKQDFPRVFSSFQKRSEGGSHKILGTILKKIWLPAAPKMTLFPDLGYGEAGISRAISIFFPGQIPVAATIPFFLH